MSMHLTLSLTFAVETRCESARGWSRADSLDPYEPIHSCGEDCVTNTNTGGSKVCCRTVAPSRPRRFVEQVSSEHIGRIGVAAGEFDPARNKVGLAVSLVMPARQMHE